MRIRQIKGADLIGAESRRRLESLAFTNLERACAEVRHQFPNHLVVNEWGKISVVVKDRSFEVAVFREVSDP